MSLISLFYSFKDNEQSCADIFKGKPVNSKLLFDVFSVKNVRLNIQSDHLIFAGNSTELQLIFD